MKIAWFLRSGKVREFKSTRVQKFTKMLKNFELLYADCLNSKIFPARFACGLFVPPLFRDMHKIFRAETETIPETHVFETETRLRCSKFCLRRDV